MEASPLGQKGTHDGDAEDDPGGAGARRRRIACVPTCPSQARRWVMERGTDLPHSQLDLLILLVSELVTNSVRHSGADPGEHVQIAFERGDGTIHVDVRDTGPGFDPPDLRPGPHGLQVVESRADRWGIERSAPTTVWFELDVA